ncbi:YgiQ family radical SAM protein [Tyzzerella sp. OttesenSCG-928-J15]|nr:YgiQ family radical SAM protein [Tyzzerella sp. OttesenSCG-928-J15]
MAFLPVTIEELHEKGVEQADYIIVSGDAYVDHPSFGAAIIGRLLESFGNTVGIIAQPDWKDVESFKALGKPKYGFMVTGGNIDSMVNHYTVAKKRRSTDSYSPGGKGDLRPDRATIVYSNKIKEAYKDAFIILGGIEASLRRLSHYDYWDNKVRRSILLDSGADILVYGMAEHQIKEISDCFKNNDIEAMKGIRGICYREKELPYIEKSLELPHFNLVKKDADIYCESFMNQHNNSDAFTGQTLIEPYNEGFVIQNPPAMPISTPEFDNVYALPYMKNYHTMYEKDGGVPAIKEVKFSIISNRGCFGSCNFCALTFHQGRIVQTRSHTSILREAESLVWEPDFKGYIHDVGGPTANFRAPACKKQLTHGACKDRECLFPTPCKNLDISHKDYMKLLRSLRDIPKVKKVFVRSGIRYDYLINDKDGEFFKDLCQHHISGQLKVAPEHISAKVLEKMGKPGKDVYDKFTKKYYEINKNLGLKQYLVPYLMSSHPGSDLAAAIELAEYLRDINFTPEQVQDFYPTPGTLSTCMYYTGKDPRYMTDVYVPKTPHEKALQRALIQYKNPKNYQLVKEALVKAGRQDLIGFGKECLIRPTSAPQKKQASAEKKKPAPPLKKKTIRNVHKKKSVAK